MNSFIMFGWVLKCRFYQPLNLNSSLHWLILGFLYAFFVQLSILATKINSYAISYTPPSYKRFSIYPSSLTHMQTVFFSFLLCLKKRQFSTSQLESSRGRENTLIYSIVRKTTFWEQKQVHGDYLNPVQTRLVTRYWFTFVMFHCFFVQLWLELK